MLDGMTYPMSCLPAHCTFQGCHPTSSTNAACHVGCPISCNSVTYLNDIQAQERAQRAEKKRWFEAPYKGRAFSHGDLAMHTGAHRWPDSASKEPIGACEFAQGDLSQSAPLGKMGLARDILDALKIFYGHGD